MILPFLLLAFGVGAATIFLAPKVSSFVESHLKGAFSSHAEADQHLFAAVTTAVPITLQAQAPQRQTDAETLEQLQIALHHLQQASAANQAAAASTATAATVAKTPVEKKVVAASANQVIDRQAKIAALKRQLGVGQCGIRSYERVNARIRDALISKMKLDGMTVTGTNPWDINTNKYDVKLRALWDAATETLHIIVTAGEGGYLGLVTCDQIWARIEPVVRSVIGTPTVSGYLV